MLLKLSEKRDISFEQFVKVSRRRQKSCSDILFSDSLTRALLKLSPVYTLGRLTQAWPTVSNSSGETGEVSCPVILIVNAAW